MREQSLEEQPSLFLTVDFHNKGSLVKKNQDLLVDLKISYDCCLQNPFPCRFPTEFQREHKLLKMLYQCFIAHSAA
jgi:hypothetical protein